jgi:hypothetical protein
MNLQRRLRLLEKRLLTEPIVLTLSDGRTETLRGSGDYVLNLFLRAYREEKTPHVELLAQSVGPIQEGDGHLLELARAILNSPKEDLP